MITVSIEKMKEIVNVFSAVSDKKSVVPEIRDILISYVKDSNIIMFHANNWDIRCRATVPVLSADDGDKSISFILPFSQFAESIKAIPKGNNVGIAFKKDVGFDVNTDTNEFLNFGNLKLSDEKQSALVSVGAYFWEAVSDVLERAAKEKDNREALRGVFLDDSWNLVGTNGKRLKKISVPVNYSWRHSGIIIPSCDFVKNICKYVNKEAYIRLFETKNEVKYIFTSYVSKENVAYDVFIKGCEKTYPNWKATVPDKAEMKSILFAEDDVSKIVSLCKLVNKIGNNKTDKDKCIIFNIKKDGRVSIEGKVAEGVKVGTFELKFDGFDNNYELCVRPEFLVSGFDTGREMFFKNATSPILFDGGGAGFEIVMPVPR